MVLSFRYLIKHTDKLTSHCIDVVADDNDDDDGVMVCPSSMTLRPLFWSWSPRSRRFA